jgi:nitrous oxidase accessory protein NosD
VVRHCDLTYNLFGLWIEKADDVRVEGNTITGKRDYNSAQRGNGVQLYNTKGAALSTTTSASCAMRSTSMCRTTRSSRETGCTIAATARTT